MDQFPLLLGTPWPWWSIVLLGAGTGYFTLRGYRRRATEVKPARLKLLKWMRIAAWTLLLLCLLDPIQRQFSSEDKKSRLTVLIDDSESMSFADARKGPSRMERVKSALAGELALAKSADAREPVPPDRDALLPALTKSFAVQMEAFSGASRMMPQNSAYDVAVFSGDLKALGESTDIARALSESLARLNGPDAGGLIVVTDGADTARGEIERVAAQYKRLGIPIYTVGVGALDQQDLAITQVRCNRVVSKDTLARIAVDVRATGLPDGKHKVTISRNGQVQYTQDVELKNGLGTALFDAVKPPSDAQGFLEYEATVEPFPGELVIANNTMGFGFVAFSRKLKVLYMEGSMFIHKVYDSKSEGMYYSHPMQHWWEHQFLQRAVEEDGDIEMDFLAKNKNWTPDPNNPIDDIKDVKEGFPKTKKELYQYDVIISSDIPYDFFTEEQIQAQVDFVGKHGGGFAMVGGYDAFGEGKYAGTIIDRMLPVEMNANDDHVDHEDFRWKIPEEAWHAGANGTPHPLLLVDSSKDEEKSRKAWDRLPIFHGFSKTTRPKPTVIPLAVVADDQYDTIYGPAILLAAQQYGAGRSMAFTTDTTGSWGTEWEDSWGPPGETDLQNRNLYYKNFWKNAVRWLAEYRMKAPNQLVNIETDRLVYGRGEVPDVYVKVLNQDLDPTTEAEVKLTLTGPDGKSQTVNAFAKIEDPGMYFRKLDLGGVGRYEIEAVAKLGKEELGRDKAILQVRPATAELRQTGQNVELLKMLAEKSGGKYFPIEKIAELPKNLQEATHPIITHRDSDLWDRPWIFVLIVALFCGEWFLRKRSGMP